MTSETAASLMEMATWVSTYCLSQAGVDKNAHTLLRTAVQCVCREMQEMETRAKKAEAELADLRKQNDRRFDLAFATVVEVTRKQQPQQQQPQHQLQIGDGAQQRQIGGSSSVVCSRCSTTFPLSGSFKGDHLLCPKCRPKKEPKKQ